MKLYLNCCPLEGEKCFKILLVLKIVTRIQNLEIFQANKVKKYRGFFFYI